ncbi:2922_t:CDS:10 [Ambispora gerdemannii]|uniref:GTPase-activating protein GYP7 n=1 Tax=Ambispora gerdemannii TaxID=144530 RepID=A0A9N8YN58_9GLOM|nr:2922_t:CDS:10 [Ambispora gerdemannii]
MGGGIPPPEEQNNSKNSPSEMVQLSSILPEEFTFNTNQRDALHQLEQQMHVSQVRLVYSKSKVYVHPSNNDADNIPGYISILERSPKNYYLAWTPESLLSADQLESYVQVEAYPGLINSEEDEGWLVEEGIDDDEHGLGSTILISPPVSLTNVSSPTAETLYATSAPISSIYSIVVLPPKFTQWYGSIIINLIGGNTLPAFVFHDDESRSTRLQRKRQKEASNHTDDQEETENNTITWGGDEVIYLLKKFCHVHSSSIEPNLFLINPSPEDISNHSPPISDETSTSNIDTSRTGPSSIQMDPLTATVKEIRWNVLEKFSKVSRFTRDTAASILEHPLARPILPHLPPAVNSFVQNESTHSDTNDTHEFDYGRIYLAKWAARVAEEAEAAAILEQDESNNSRLAAWRGQLIDDADSSKSWQEETELGAFEILSSGTSLPPIHHTRTTPLKADNWFSFFDAEGRLQVELKEVRAAIFCGGVEEDIRVEVWKFLLGFYPWESSQVERENIMEAKHQEYWNIKRKWWDSPDIHDDPDFQEQKNRIDVYDKIDIEKDVVRTDRTVPFFKNEDLPHPEPLSSSSNFTNKNLELMKDILMTYNFYNTDLGYVQGMSDLLAPIFAVMLDEVTAFWTFAGFMERMKSNFYRDQSGMRRQLLTLDHLIQFMDPRLYKHLQRAESLNLFCCFRWLLIWFKREFKWDEVPRLWEVLWSDHLTGQFHIFVALAILDKHRLVIMDYLNNFDEILKYINDLSMTISLEETLCRAEMLFYQFQRMVEAVDQKRLELEQQESNSQNDEGLRRRKGKETETETEGDPKSSTESTSKLPVVNDLLRSLLNKEFITL